MFFSYDSVGYLDGSSYLCGASRVLRRLVADADYQLEVSWETGQDAGSPPHKLHLMAVEVSS